MDGTRREKVAANIMTTVANTLNNGSIKDPRLGFITVTSVKVMGDLQHAKVYYTAYGNDSARDASTAALASAEGAIRSRVGKSLGARLTPILESCPNPLPTQATAVEDALVVTQQADTQLVACKSETYANEADPYKELHNNEAE